MAGVAISFDPVGREAESKSLVIAMAQSLSGCLSGYYVVDACAEYQVALARRRPDLVNLQAQPAWNRNRTICALFEGELFGDGTAGGSFADLVVRLYEQRGDAFVEALNGSFVLAIWDAPRRRLLLANDRYGMRPLYTACHRGRHLWASSPSALLVDPTFPRSLHVGALADFLALSLPQAGDTLFDGIEEVPPASLVVCEHGKVRRREYWDLQFQEQETGVGIDDCADGIVEHLRRAAARRQGGTLAAGLLLSGGFDSRLVLAAMRPDGLRTFSFGMEGCNDHRYAQRVAKLAGVSHRSMIVQPDYLSEYAAAAVRCTGDLLNCTYYHGISIFPDIAREVNALVTGSVGEDVFGHFSRDPSSERWGAGFTLDRYYDVKSIASDDELAVLIDPCWFREIRGLARARFQADMARCQSSHVTHRLDYWSVRQQQRRLWCRLSQLFPENLAFRPIFLDNDLVDFAQTLPRSQRWGEHSAYRRALQRLHPKLAALPATTTHGLPLTAGPRAVKRALRVKTLQGRLSKLSRSVIPPPRGNGFMDYDAGFRGPLSGWINEILADPRTMSRGLWNMDGVMKLWDDFLHGRATMKRMAAKLGAVVSLEL
jgi:asparagine synthetase B (glutamine-hydrolysing)